MYEDAYSLDTVYSPETLMQANADGRLYSIVARSSRGDVLGHCALYPAPQCACLYEEGMLVVVPEYRNGAIAKQLVRYGLEVLAPAGACAGGIRQGGLQSYHLAKNWRRLRVS